MELASYQEVWRAYEFKTRKVFPPVKLPRLTEFFNTSFSSGIIVRGKNRVRVTHGNYRQHLAE